MSQDRLDILMRLRAAELDDARRALGEALAEEDTARAARDAAEAAIVAETRAATHSADDHDVERFARWLKRGRATLAKAETALADAAGITAHRRAELTLTRAAAEAVAQAIEQRDQQAQAAAGRAEQREMDEVGSRRR